MSQNLAFLLPRLAVAILGLGLLTSLVGASGPVLRHWQGDFGAVSLPIAAPRTKAAQPPVDITPIRAASLFGQAPPKGRSQPAPDLTLEGVATAQDPARTFAMIRAGEATRSYRIGSEVAPGLTLTEIRGDHVVLTSASGPITLAFDQADTRPAQTTGGAARLGALLGTGENDDD